MKPLRALLARELAIAWRQGGGIGRAVGYYLVVVVLLPLGIGPDQALLAQLAPGALWAVLLLAVLLSADRILQADHEQGALELMLLSPVPLELTILCKALAHWLTTGLPLALAAPLLGFLLNLQPDAFGPLVVSTVIGTPALSLLGALGAALTLGVRRGGLLISVLILPLYVPVLVFGTGATAAAVSGSGAFVPSLLILLALALAAIVLAPVAAAAAVRAHYR